MTTRLLAPILVLFLASSAFAVCGDGTIDAGEECDDGNTTSGDGCSATCVFEGCPLTGTWHSTVPFDIEWTLIEAGDGTISGKSWPTGITNPRFVTPLTGTRTGSAVSINGYTGTMHECDALTISGNGSTFDLSRIRSTYCGDGTIDAPYENCDPLAPGNGPGGCDIDCFSICGDGMIEGLEQCDDGNHTDGDGCSSTCQTSVCGNGTIEPGEQCDDGNTTNGDGCSFHCQTTVCGNGVIEDGEDCDDGNATSGDGCSSTCVFEGCPLTGTWQSAVPSSFTWTLVEAPDGTVSGLRYPAGSPADAAPVTGSRAGLSVSLTFGGQTFTGTMDNCDQVPMLNSPFFFYLLRARSTYCGDGTTQAPDETCDDGNLTNDDGCTVACTAAVCGNGIAEAPEQCDDGNATNGDGCSTTCQTNVCGNGIVEPGELCDDLNTTNGDGCSAHCQPNVCGNGTIEDGEDCDDGNTANGDGCTSLCAFVGCPLTGTWESGVVFRSDLTWTLIEAADGTISGVAYEGGAASITSPVTGTRTGTAVSLSLGSLAVTGTMSDCDHIPLTFASITSTLTRTRSTYCGDGVQQAAFEVCDDGNLANGDTCTAGCTEPTGCGDGILETGEECDDANGASDDACVAGCLLNVCGDGFVHAGTEVCDDGNTTSGDGCAADCLSLEEETAGGAVGGSVLTITTDTEADGATPSDPVETTLSAPAGTISGTLAITEQTAPPTAPGFVFMGTSVQVTATNIVPAPTATTPLVLSFQIDASVIPSGQSESTIEIRKDGALVPGCAGAPGVASPDACVATRDRLADGDVAITILTTTLSDWDFFASVCGAGPALACQPAKAGKGRLKIKAGSNRDAFGWTWRSSAETALSIFGDPRTTNDYTLCLYGSGGLLMQLTAPAGTTCKDGKPCWALGSKGFKYADRSAAHDGVTKVVLEPGGAGKAKLGLNAKGQLDLAALPLTLPVSVQLRAKDGACFQAAFGAAKRNDAVKFQATND